VREAEKLARGLERERLPWSSAHAQMIRASVDAARGKTRQAAEGLLTAAGRYAASDMRLHAAAARRRAGLLLGGDEGRALVEAADALFEDVGARNPAAFSSVYCPASYPLDAGSATPPPPTGSEPR
jgi:hypothetical protein